MNSIEYKKKRKKLLMKNVRKTQLKGKNKLLKKHNKGMKEKKQ